MEIWSMIVFLKSHIKFFLIRLKATDNGFLFGGGYEGSEQAEWANKR